MWRSSDERKGFELDDHAVLQIVHGHMACGAMRGIGPEGQPVRVDVFAHRVVLDVDGELHYVVQRGAARIEKEQRSRERLRAGELGLDFYDLRAKLKELGVEYVDQ